MISEIDKIMTPLQLETQAFFDNMKNTNNTLEINKIIITSRDAINQPWKKLKKYLILGFEDLKNIDYYEYHTILIDSFYKVMSFYKVIFKFGKVHNNLSNEKISTFLELRKLWTHPFDVVSSKNIPKDHQKITSVCPSYDKSEVTNSQSFIVGFYKLNEEGSVDKKYEEYNTREVIIQALETIK